MAKTPETIDLDPLLQRTAATLAKALGAWEKLEPTVTRFMTVVDERIARAAEAEQYVSRRDGKPIPPEAWTREVAQDLTSTLEKLSRALLNMTKLVDETARLRSFLSGGPDSRPDLEGMSDGELVKILVDVAVERGLWRLIERRVKPVEIEASAG